MNFTVTNIGNNGNSAPAMFSIFNIETLLSNYPSFTAFSNIGGPMAGVVALTPKEDVEKPAERPARIHPNSPLNSLATHRHALASNLVCPAPHGREAPYWRFAPRREDK